MFASMAKRCYAARDISEFLTPGLYAVCFRRAAPFRRLFFVACCHAAATP
jgi:hypothetical protein